MNDSFQRQIDAHDHRLDLHAQALDSLSEWRAMVKGFLMALTVFASMPTIVLGFMALTGAFSK